MHCAQARNQIALLVGGDLDDFGLHEVERHLGMCRNCTDYRQRMEVLRSQLEAVGSADSVSRGDSLWPALEPAVRVAERDRLVRRFNGWVAGVAIAATVLAMVTISRDYEPPRTYPDFERSAVATEIPEWRSLERHSNVRALRPDAAVEPPLEGWAPRSLRVRNDDEVFRPQRLLLAP